MILISEKNGILKGAGGRGVRMPPYTLLDGLDPWQDWDLCLSTVK